MPGSIPLLQDRLFWFKGSVLASTVMWVSGNGPVLTVNGTSVFLSRNEN